MVKKLEGKVEDLRKIRKEAEGLGADSEALAEIAESTGSVVANLEVWKKRAQFEAEFLEHHLQLAERYPMVLDPESEFAKQLNVLLDKAIAGKSDILKRSDHLRLMSDVVAKGLKIQPYETSMEERERKAMEHAEQLRIK